MEPPHIGLGWESGVGRGVRRTNKQQAVIVTTCGPKAETSLDFCSKLRRDSESGLRFLLHETCIFRFVAPPPWISLEPEGPCVSENPPRRPAKVDMRGPCSTAPLLVRASKRAATSVTPLRCVLFSRPLSHLDHLSHACSGAMLL
jgi:hypothetical protein